MASVNVDEIRSRVEEDWPRIVELIERKIALKSISAEGITGEQMRQAASAMLQVLFDADPTSVGGALPDDALYASLD